MHVYYILDSMTQLIHKETNKDKAMEYLPFLLSLTLVATIAFISFRRRHSNQTKQSGGDSLLDLIKNSHRILDYTTDLLASSPTSTISTSMGIITSNPANIQHILKSHFPNYPKGDHAITILHDFLGRGIFNSDGDHWKLQRRTATLGFAAKSFRALFMDTVCSELETWLLPLLARAGSGEMVVDLQAVLERLALVSVCKVVFDEDPEESAEGREFARAFEEASELIVRRYWYPMPLWKVMRVLRVGYEKRLREQITIVHQFAMQVIRARKAVGAGSHGDDVLSGFIAESTDYSDEFLRDIITSFVVAGRDTTSATLTWFFWLISTRPAVKNRIVEEVRRVRKSHSSEPHTIVTVDELRGMDYLHAALSETLRLYPPVPLQMRMCEADDVLPSGMVTRRGTTMMYNSYAMGRMESVWGPDCREYKPERWLNVEGVFQPKSPFVFPVFHAGPRMCLGKEMAYIQMKAVAASVMERFEVEVLDKERERELDLIMILKVKGGLPVKVREKVRD